MANHPQKPHPCHQRQDIDWSRWKVLEIPPPKDLGDCRYCGHESWVHKHDLLRPCDYGMYDIKASLVGSTDILIPKKVADSCACLEYVPSENLAYLEWKVKRGY